MGRRAVSLELCLWEERPGQLGGCCPWFISFPITDCLTAAPHPHLGGLGAAGD